MTTEATIQPPCDSGFNRSKHLRVATVSPSPPEEDEGTRCAIEHPPRLVQFDELRPNDIIFGRGGRANKHFKGSIFRVIVSKWKHQYKESMLGEKKTITNLVVEELRACGCRFLERVGHTDDEVWQEVTEEKRIYKKVMQSLRDRDWRSVESAKAETCAADDQADPPSRNLRKRRRVSARNKAGKKKKQKKEESDSKGTSRGPPPTDSREQGKKDQNLPHQQRNGMPTLSTEAEVPPLPKNKKQTPQQRNSTATLSIEAVPKNQNLSNHQRNGKATLSAEVPPPPPPQHQEQPLEAMGSVRNSENDLFVEYSGLYDHLRPLLLPMGRDHLENEFEAAQEILNPTAMMTNPFIQHQEDPLDLTVAKRSDMEEHLPTLLQFPLDPFGLPGEAFTANEAATAGRETTTTQTHRTPAVSESCTPPSRNGDDLGMLQEIKKSIGYLIASNGELLDKQKQLEQKLVSLQETHVVLQEKLSRPEAQHMDESGYFGFSTEQLPDVAATRMDFRYVTGV